MPNRTREFAELYGAKSTAYAAKDVTPARADAVRRLRKRKRANDANSSDNVNLEDPDIDVWSLEAGRVASSLRSLALFLASIRRAYLDLSSSASHGHGSKGKASTGTRGELNLSKGLLEAWKDVKWLDDRERDEVDWQAKTVLRRCMGRVKELEQAEKNRHSKAKQQLGTSPANNLSRFLGLPSIQHANDSEKAEELLNAHRQQVVLFLSRRLTDVGRIQHEQQETRVSRQLERQNMSTNTALANMASLQSKGKGGDDPLGNGVPDMFVPAPITTGGYGEGDYGEDGYDAPIDSLLSQEQIQQFESESSALLQEANSQLAAIEKAQTSLLEISNLQSELAVHLTQQMEITDQLWEDSVLVSGRVDEGNKQLQKAKERNREGRLWLLIFLIGASLSLLFLEYY